MLERIKAMGLEAIADECGIDVRGDNAKLIELQGILDVEGYKNETKMVEMFFGITAPKQDEVTRIIINYTCGETGYCLVA